MSEKKPEHDKKPHRPVRSFILLLGVIAIFGFVITFLQIQSRARTLILIGETRPSSRP